MIADTRHIVFWVDARSQPRADSRAIYLIKLGNIIATQGQIMPIQTRGEWFFSG